MLKDVCVYVWLLFRRSQEVLKCWIKGLKKKNLVDVFSCLQTSTSPEQACVGPSVFSQECVSPPGFSKLASKCRIISRGLVWSTAKLWNSDCTCQYMTEKCWSCAGLNKLSKGRSWVRCFDVSTSDWTVQPGLGKKLEDTWPFIIPVLDFSKGKRAALICS